MGKRHDLFLYFELGVSCVQAATLSPAAILAAVLRGAMRVAGRPVVAAVATPCRGAGGAGGNSFLDVKSIEDWSG